MGNQQAQAKGIAERMLQNKALQENNGACSVAIIGGGKMGEALLAGLLRSSEYPAKALSPESFIVANPGEQRRAYLQQTYGVACVSDAACITKAPDVVVLAVKPQILPAVLESLRGCVVLGSNAESSLDASVQQDDSCRTPLIVSIAAGVTTATLRSLLPEGARVVRTMPNTPLLVGLGMTAVVGDGGATNEDVRFVRDLFSCLGKAAIVDEADMDAACAVSGSGPAYVAAFVEALRDGGVRQGLEPSLAQELALQTVLGTAHLMSDTDNSPEEVRLAVCSPKGTTLAALDAMNELGFGAVIERGVAAATKRSIELGALS